ncbi:D-Ala-D-Ala carboxypeptidase family metallohydrolase [Candidatus Nitrotoga sp. 1052]|uniref:D-Ala-D-Ala carboxypeptidase family metallohydrolase n=1 Tax=Candidatus Nitrotoga sp. 1052 TaxID=2886964 RepID=UPI001EF5D220|nr:D-Ala-D-Ala carboxypeptidase family metallohydrolase [Candidatus Nitrotoga sp. 1052]CAH1082869.1 Peptidase_M15_3 domain-containing protein [Candidatus Nitrotoga sp. 1052]
MEFPALKNIYTYVGGNPISWVDPLGLRIFNPSGKIISDEVLDALREFNKKIGCDKDISITDGDRPASAKIGAGKKSKHVQHLAADIKVRDQTHLETANQARLSGIFGGIGWYEEGYSGPRGEGPHVHVDLRDSSAMWGYNKDGKEYHRSFPKYSPDQKLSPSQCGCE